LRAGLAAAAMTDLGAKHRSSTRNAPRPRAFRGKEAKKFSILKNRFDFPKADAQRRG